MTFEGVRAWGCGHGGVQRLSLTVVVDVQRVVQLRARGQRRALALDPEARERLGVSEVSFLYKYPRAKATDTNMNTQHPTLRGVLSSRW